MSLINNILLVYSIYALIIAIRACLIVITPLNDEDLDFYSRHNISGKNIGNKIAILFLNPLNLVKSNKKIYKKVREYFNENT